MMAFVAASAESEEPKGSKRPRIMCLSIRAANFSERTAPFEYELAPCLDFAVERDSTGQRVCSSTKSARESSRIGVRTSCEGACPNPFLESPFGPRRHSAPVAMPFATQYWQQAEPWA